MELEKFHAIIFDWWKINKRVFPWRNTLDPYKILVSEFMLQQTQASRVIPKYLDFLGKFPTISALAKSNNKDLLSAWSGLGYNRRAVWLKSIACSIIDLGYFPTKPNELSKFKGIGPYTSRSIPIFAFNADLAAIDVNIKRILLHFRYVNQDTKNNDIQEIANNIVPKGRSRDWHNALMDYGSANLKNVKIKYVKPQKFKGSNRELRGKIIKLLTEFESLSASEIYEKLEDDRISQLLPTLVSDGLVTTKDEKYLL